MANKDIKINYYWPLAKYSGTDVIFPLEKYFEKLVEIDIEDRVADLPDRENIQLKDIQLKGDKWILCFLRNKSDSIFKGRLSDAINSAEPLDDDEFIGYECVVIYDIGTKLLAVQNNRNSIGAKKLSLFLDEIFNISISMSILTYTEEARNIFDNDKIEYKSLILGFTRLNELKRLDNEEDDNIKKIYEVAQNIGALGGKLEFNVGRSKGTFLNKFSIEGIVKSLKGFSGKTALKLKVIEGDSVRLVDLVNDKVCSTGNIVVSKDDPKTFDKIIKTMEEQFDEALTNELKYCKIITRVIGM